MVRDQLDINSSVNNQAEVLLLDNGLELIVKEMPDVESVSVGVFTKVSGYQEPESLRGIAHFLEHMLFKGTARRKSKQITQEIDALGGAMAEAIDHAGIQFRVLNASKGPAVRATRAQADRVLYKAAIRKILEHQENLTLFQQAVDDLLIEGELIREYTLETPVIGDSSIPGFYVTSYDDALSIGEKHVCGIFDGGSLNCWGWDAGQLGLGIHDGSGSAFNNIQFTPAEINIGSNISAVSVSAGHDHTCAIMNNGSLMCWGESSRYSPSNTDSQHISVYPEFVDIGNVLPVKVSAGEYHTCMILEDGTLKCHGDSIEEWVQGSGNVNIGENWGLLQ